MLLPSSFLFPSVSPHLPPTVYPIQKRKILPCFEHSTLLPDNVKKNTKLNTVNSSFNSLNDMSFTDQRDTWYPPLTSSYPHCLLAYRGQLVVCGFGALFPPSHEEHPTLSHAWHAPASRKPPGCQMAGTLQRAFLCGHQA